MPDPFFASFSHTPGRQSTCPASHASKSVASRKAITSAVPGSGFVDTGKTLTWRSDGHGPALRSTIDRRHGVLGGAGYRRWATGKTTKGFSMLRGISTVNLWADDLAAATRWYTELLGA